MKISENCTVSPYYDAAETHTHTHTHTHTQRHIDPPPHKQDL